MSAQKIYTSILVIILLVIAIYGCKQYYIDHSFRQNYSDVNELIHNDVLVDTFFKIHLKNGNASILENWQLDSSRDSIIGHGKLYDFNRNEIHDGNLAFNLDDIAIIETNQLDAIKSRDNARIASLSILTGVNVALGVVCITNPKTCFGSCPTFYVDDQNLFHAANAEGFSSSIAPSLEKIDLDALQYSTSSNEFYLTMKNEALETHVVNKISIEAVPKIKNQAVYHDRYGKYYQCTKSYQLSNASVDGKNISDDLLIFDEYEYYSTTDSTDLFTKEELIIEFDKLPKSEFGVVVNYRQSLLTTFLLYSGISFMGDEVGDHFAKIETDKRIKKRFGSPFRKLGGIKISVWIDKEQKWKFQEELNETGPIAKNLMLVPIPESIPANGHLKIKLEMTKGHWRLDYIGLTSIDKVADPISISPSEVEVIDGGEYSINEVIADDGNYLLSFPGNEFRFKFELPQTSDNINYELFLSSKGYYLEWIRNYWIKGKDLPKLKKMLLNDAQTWRELAEEFKTIEAEAESVFWNSKYSRIQ